MNAFVFSLSNELDVICLNSIEQSTLIHTLCDLLEAFENFEGEEELNELVAKSEILLDRTRQLLLRLHLSAQKLAMENSFVFITSPLRTEKLIRVRKMLKNLKNFLEPLVSTSNRI